MGIGVVKTVYAPAAPEDGCRLIIMRRYPRGFRKDRAHAWVPQLAPSLPLVHWYHETLDAIRAPWPQSDAARCEREIARFWKAYSRRYLTEMRAQRRLIEMLAAMHYNFGVPLTLLCACPDYRICHRSLLGNLISETERA
ncbi:MAG: DUF488 domain-containing protein [Gammaproteobacteria bacterium]